MLIQYINPIFIEYEQEYDLLVMLFEQYKTEQVFHQRNVYHLIRDSIYLDVQLANTVLRSDTSPKDTFYIVSNKTIGRGSFGTVCPIDNELYLPNEYENAYCRPSTPERIVKIYNVAYSSEADLLKLQERFHHEYEQSKDGHLMASAPLYSLYHDNEQKYVTAYLPMNKMPGMEFHEFLKWTLHPSIQVSGHARLLLSFSLLNTFYQQVVLPKKIHGDIKPENMLLAVNGVQGSSVELLIRGGFSRYKPMPKIEFNFIDYAGSAWLETYRQYLIYTEMYAAPEILSLPRDAKTYGKFEDEKTDMVSIAIIIANIWGLIPQEVRSKEYPNDIKSYLNKHFVANEPPGFKDTILRPIYAWVACMLNKNAEDRWNLEQSQILFEELFTRYHALYSSRSESPKHPSTPIERPDSVTFFNHGNNTYPEGPDKHQNQNSPISVVNFPGEQLDLSDTIQIRRTKPLSKNFVPVQETQASSGCGCAIS